MAIPEYLQVLKRGAVEWNQYWRENKIEFPDFRRANLNRLNLAGFDLRGADFTGSTFHDIDFTGAILIGSTFSETRITGCDFGDTNLIAADFAHSQTDACGFVGAKCTGANFYRASITDCLLDGAKFQQANLAYADISDSIFQSANFSEAIFHKTKFRKAVLDRTIFANNDLSSALDLTAVKHRGPSTVGIDTVYKSGGKIPDEFLLGAGVPEEVIDIARSLRAGSPIQWHSCFISHSTKDEEFARRLHSRMREANMRVWFAPEDLKGGKKLHEQLFEAIRIHDLLLIVLSEHSIQSEWVMTEICKARETEKKKKRRKLFPIRLCDMDTLQKWECFDADTGKDLAAEVREYFIPDFSNWKNHHAFEAAFARLRKDLEAENQRPKLS
jgi:hypothetical protein